MKLEQTRLVFRNVGRRLHQIGNLRVIPGQEESVPSSEIPAYARAVEYLVKVTGREKDIEIFLTDGKDRIEVKTIKDLIGDSPLPTMPKFNPLASRLPAPVAVPIPPREGEQEQQAAEPTAPRKVPPPPR